MAATGSKTSRNSALDFTKGALVLTMVLYHWTNYFDVYLDKRYLRFLTPSFIFITGFLVSNIYLSKYGSSDPQLPKRLIERGLKILGVFFVLNVSRIFVVRETLQSGGALARSPFQSLVDIYILGSGVGGGQAKAVAFFVLLPIGYLLILSALLLVACRFYRHAFYAMCIICLLSIIGLSHFEIQSPNLELVTIGLFGVITGYLPIDRVNAFVRHPYILAFAYCLYLGAITLWDVIYPLQIVGVYLSLMIIYLVGLKDGQPGYARSVVILLGKYSLFGYIVQIAILQILRMGLIHLESEIAILILSFVLAFALTIVSVELLNRTRAGSTTVDRLYKAVFA